MQKNKVRKNIKRNIQVASAYKHFSLANILLNSKPYTI